MHIISLALILIFYLTFGALAQDAQYAVLSLTAASSNASTAVVPSKTFKDDALFSTFGAVASVSVSIMDAQKSIETRTKIIYIRMERMNICYLQRRNLF